jgi:hypothetical protein
MWIKPLETLEFDNFWFGTGTMTSYRLDYPNMEVASSFTKLLLSRQTEKSLIQVSGALRNLLVSFSGNDLDGVFAALRSLFAGIGQDLQLRREKYYQSLFILVFRLRGVDLQAEVKTADGRIDAVVQQRKKIIAVGFEFNGQTRNIADWVTEDAE